jgi:hypothetical protein
MEAPERYESYWITYFDLLGFEDVVREPRNIACQIGHVDGRPRIWYALEHYRRALEEFEDFKRDYRMQGKWFSDTFLFYTKDESSDCVLKIASASGAFFRRMFGGLIPMRGCLAHGDLYSGPEDELFGPALIDAYREAEAQDWLGFIIHPNAEERMRLCEKNGRSVCKALQEYDYRDYRVPFKKKVPHDVQANSSWRCVRRFLAPFKKNVAADAQESRPSERRRRLAYTLIKPGETREHVQFLLRDLDHMQSVGEHLIGIDKDMTTEEKEKKRQDVRRKYENTREFLRNMPPALSKSA